MSNTLPPGAVQRKWGLSFWIDYLRRWRSAEDQQDLAAAHRKAASARNADEILAGIQQAAHALDEAVALLRQERAEDRHHLDDLDRRVRVLEARR